VGNTEALSTSLPCPLLTSYLSEDYPAAGETDFIYGLEPPTNESYSCGQGSHELERFEQFN
jgi:hypothetical protein